MLALVARGPFRLALLLANIFDRMLPRFRRIARRNLEVAFPDKSDLEREKIIDDVFATLARMLWTFARFPRMNRANIGQWIRYEGFEHYSRAKEQGRGVLFATAHIGNWELSAFAHALMTEPMDIVIRPLDNTGIDRAIEERRQLSGNRLIGKWDSARAIIRALGENRAVGILMDQNTALTEGVFVDFFGLQACANAAFVKLAGRTSAAVIPGYALWSEAEQRYVLKFYPAVQLKGDVVEDTQQLHRILENVIREHPGQWLWIHRRWKTRPPGEEPIY